MPRLSKADREALLHQTILEYANYSVELTQLQALRKGAATTIQEQLAALGLETFEIPDGKVRMQTTTRRVLRPEKLLLLGVPAETIEQASDTVITEPFVRWYPAKAGA